MKKSLKDDWKEAGKQLGKALNTLGKTAYKTGKEVFKALDDWAENKNDDNSNNK